jgi:hypothetical protein
MSGVVTASLRRGTQKFQWSGEIFSGDYLWNGIDRPAVDLGFPQQTFNGDKPPGRVPPALRRAPELQLTLSGPAAPEDGVPVERPLRRHAQLPLRGQQRFLNIDPAHPDSFTLVEPREGRGGRLPARWRWGS